MVAAALFVVFLTSCFINTPATLYLVNNSSRSIDQLYTRKVGTSDLIEEMHYSMIAEPGETQTINLVQSGHVDILITFEGESGLVMVEEGARIPSGGFYTVTVTD